MVSYKSLVRATGAKEKTFMKKKITYTDEPMGDIRGVHDFLPPPEELAFQEKTIKVTLQLSRRSVDFFKKEAQIHNTPYQRMIRHLLDEYTARHTR